MLNKIKSLKSKLSQHQKSKISSAIQNKSGQEEMVGFALIMIIVAVVLLIFLGFSLRNQQDEAVENYEVDSFIQAFLQYTTDCAEGYEPRYHSIRKLIVSCNNQEKCLDERNTCEVLEFTLKGIIEETWKIEGDRPIKGYNLNILSDDNNVILNISDGNITQNYKGSMQSLGKEDIDIFFSAYY